MPDRPSHFRTSCERLRLVASWAMLVAITLIVLGCELPIGGGSGSTVHTPPTQASASAPLKLDIAIAVQGRSGSVTNVMLHWKCGGGSAQYTVVPATLVSEDGTWRNYSVTITPNGCPPGTGSIEYYFGFLADGRTAARSGAVPLVP